MDRESGTSELAAAIDRALGHVAFTSHTDKPAAVLIGDQRKRPSIAIEHLRRPRPLDEPIKGPDPASEASLMERLLNLARRDIKGVCSTQLMGNLSLLDAAIVLGLVEHVN